MESVRNEQQVFLTLLEDGEEAARERQYERAKQLLSSALEIQPNSVRALRATAALHLAQSQISDARAVFERALLLDPNDPKTLSGMGMCEMMVQHPEEAYRYFVEALTINPYQLVTILQLLECSYKLDRFKDLERVLRAYLFQNSEDLEMKFCLAGCLYKMEQVTEALEILDDILNFNPEHLGSRQLKEIIEQKVAQPATRVDQIPESVQDEKTFIKTKQPLTNEPKSFDEVDLRLDCLEEEKRKRQFEAVKDGCRDLLRHQSAIRGDQIERANLLIAESLLLEGDYSGSNEIYNEVLRSNPKSARAQCGLGAMAANDGQWDKATQHFRYAHEVFPDYDVPLAGLGLCCLQRQDNDSAWNYFSRSLKSNPENTRALLGLIEIGYSLNRLPEVEKALKTYLDYHPADLNFLYSLAGCLFAQNRLNEAACELEKISLLDPEHGKARELIEMIDNRKGQKTGSQGLRT
jgi:tetratricopeptide (TPR) repeat protein